VCKFREIWLMGSRWNRALLTWQKKNKNSPRCLALASARMAPKICQGQWQTMYSECSKFYLSRFTSGGVIVERVNTVETRDKVNPILGWRYASRPVISLSFISFWIHFHTWPIFSHWPTVTGVSTTDCWCCDRTYTVHGAYRVNCKVQFAVS